MFLKLIFKSLWIDLRGSSTFVLALSVGLIGLSVIFSVRSAVESHMKKKAQEILSADLSLSARRIFDDEERGKIINLLGERKSHTTLSLFTMASGRGVSKLTYLKAIPEDYPYYGTLQTENDAPLDFSSKGGQSVIYGDQQLFDQLRVKEGDLVQIGNKSFYLAGLITEDSSQNLRFSALAPKAYIKKEDLSGTGLIDFGSTVSETFYVFEPEPERLRSLKQLLSKEIPDSSIRIQTASESAQNSIRALRYLADYLGLISLVGFLLSALGAGFIFFESLGKQLKVFSIFQSLGLSRKRSLIYLVTLILFLSGLASILSFIISFPLFKLISEVLLNKFSMEVPLTINPMLLSWLFGLSFISAVIISLPHFWALMKAPMRTLLDSDSQGLNIEKSGWIIFIIASLFVFFVSFLLARSFKIASFFTSGLLFTFILVGSLGVFLTSILRRFHFTSWMKVAFQEMSGKRKTQVILFSVMTVSILMLNTIKQVEHSLQEQLTVGELNEIPDYFLFDIQDDQIGPLRGAIETSGLKLLQASPMIRAKMISINGESYEVPLEESRFETREEEEEARFRNRGLNLSYRAELQRGEFLTEGSPLDPTHVSGQPLQLSIEEDYARRVDIEVGGLVQMNVQGLTINGVVTNLRRVSWTTFLPNFFVVAQPGLLEMAPKTWLAGLSRGSPEQTAAMLGKLNQQFPNISYVDLDQVVEKIREITGQMSQALILTALLVLIAGLFILFSVSRYHFFESQKDLNLLKVLGADSTFLSKKVLVEQLTLAGVSLVLGLGGSLVISYLLLDRVFEARLQWSFETPLLLSGGLILLSFLMTFLVYRWSRHTSPKSFLS